MNGRRRRLATLAVAVCLVLLVVTTSPVCHHRCSDSDGGASVVDEGGSEGWGDSDSDDEAFESAFDGTGAERGEGSLDAGDVRGSLTSFAVCESNGTLVGSKAGAMGVRATWEMQAGVTECAREVLVAYESDGLSLQYDGYIDLLGRVWGCAVWSEEGWAEIVLVDGRQDGDDSEGWTQGEGCELTVARFGMASEESE